MYEVSKHLHPFFVKRGIWQLTDHMYDMSMSIFYNYLVTVLLNELLRCIVRHGTPVCAVWTAMGLLYKLRIMVKCVWYTGLWIHWFRDFGATIPNGSITIGQTSLVGVGHSRSDSIVPLMLYTVCYTMAGALALYYRSLRTAPTLLRMDNISGRPYMGVMTYKTLAFSTLKHLGNYCWF
jgi:hypothetical protein